MDILLGDILIDRFNVAAFGMKGSGRSKVSLVMRDLCKREVSKSDLFLKFYSILLLAVQLLSIKPGSYW